ncbi:Metalloproteinase inhibitor 3 [Dissostichus eleginoides]|uniref:Metalloproteinase inhibitor 3 n=1 Tax=Dissostichus eleginoides TaxID=100907 RepID=A0AAD9CIX7_DISEL|nr:Metalloproteinase inhibitor 3 [Dissostichus eleginoides]
MSLRFTVSKSDGDRRPSDIQGEVNQLFEGDEPNTSTAVEGEDAAGSEVVVELKEMGKALLKDFPSCTVCFAVAELQPCAGSQHFAGCHSDTVHFH